MAHQSHKAASIPPTGSPHLRAAALPRRRRSKLLFLGTFVHSAHREELFFWCNAAVAVDEEGIIVAIERDPEEPEQGATAAPGSPHRKASRVTAAAAAAQGQKLLRDLGWQEEEVEVVATRADRHEFFFPGFIDAHVHAPQYPNVGIFGKTTLLGWLTKYTFPLEASLNRLSKARRVYAACVRRTLAHGTTTAAYYATLDVAATNLLADICLERGQRAFIGRVCMDRPETCPDYYRDESAEAGLQATAETIAHVRAIDPDFALLTPILTPRFAPSCSSEAMRGLARLHREEKLPLQTHISENVGELQLVARLFPEASSYADVYDRHGLLTDRTILAHAIHLSDEEAQLIAARGAKVAHCPCSNSSITSGEARVRWLWGNGIHVGLGTDMSGGYSPSVLAAARSAALVSRHLAMHESEGAAFQSCKLTVEEVLYLATRGGAHVLGLADTIGAFAVGMHWDAQLVRLGRDVDSGETAAGLGKLDDDDEEEEEASDAKTETRSKQGIGGSDAIARVEVDVNETQKLLRAVGVDPHPYEYDDADGANVDIFGWETWEEMMAKWLFNGDDRNTRKVWVKGRLVHARS